MNPEPNWWIIGGALGAVLVAFGLWAWFTYGTKRGGTKDGEL